MSTDRWVTGESDVTLGTSHVPAVGAVQAEGDGGGECPGDHERPPDTQTPGTVAGHTPSPLSVTCRWLGCQPIPRSGVSQDVVGCVELRFPVAPNWLDAVPPDDLADGTRADPEVCRQLRNCDHHATPPFYLPRCLAAFQYSRSVYVLWHFAQRQSTTFDPRGAARSNVLVSHVMHGTSDR
jgi:hypothetical protein